METVLCLNYYSLIKVFLSAAPPQGFCQDTFCSTHEFCGEDISGRPRCLCRADFASKYRSKDALGKNVTQRTDPESGRFPHMENSFTATTSKVVFPWNCCTTFKIFWNIYTKNIQEDVKRLMDELPTKDSFVFLWLGGRTDINPEGDGNISLIRKWETLVYYWTIHWITETKLFLTNPLHYLYTTGSV